MKIASKIYTVLIMIFLYAPIGVLIVFSFNNSKSRAVWEGFTFKWYEELIRDDSIMNALKNTLIVAVVASVCATIIGSIAAIGIFHLKKLPKSIVLQVSNIPMLNPEIVTGISLMLMFVFIGKALGGQGLGFTTLILAHITFNIPYVILSVMPKLRQMDKHLYEAAQDLGCPPIEAFFKAVVPEIMPGIVTGFIMAFTLSVDDFVISYFTSGPTSQTLSVLIESMTRKRISPKINALSTLMFIVVLILLIIVNMRQGNETKKKTVEI